MGLPGSFQFVFALIICLAFAKKVSLHWFGFEILSGYFAIDEIAIV